MFRFQINRPDFDDEDIDFCEHRRREIEGYLIEYDFDNIVSIISLCKECKREYSDVLEECNNCKRCQPNVYLYTSRIIDDSGYLKRLCPNCREKI